MRNACTIYRRELKSYFSSPIAYLLTSQNIIVASAFSTASDPGSPWPHRFVDYERIMP